MLSLLRRNRAAFSRLEFLPDMPRDVAEVDTSATVLGQRVPLPFTLSPIGAPRLFRDLIRQRPPTAPAASVAAVRRQA
jgi:isopentenyl diphosphate isomerase/L-lactate dehydrogenase-like FMN-dependent dehydrogenase